MNTRIMQIVTLLALSLSGALALAQDYVIYNGGVGQQERAEAPQEGVKLEFFIASGSFLADVNVTVMNAEGEQLLSTTAGPWLILDLPDGRYQVRAERENGQAQSAVIEVGQGRDSYGFSFPE